MAAINEDSLFDLTDEELEALNTASFETRSTESENTATAEPVTEQEEQTAEEPPVQPTEPEQPQEEAPPATEPQNNEETPPVVSGSSEEASEESDGPTVEELKEFYRAMNTPFKAGGTEMQIRSVDEAIRLMQQGVGYTKRMQELAPQRKLVMLLEKHGLTDPSQLSYLIDIHNRNPEAIKKLLIDSKIDPMDIDTSEAPAYQPSNHQVSDTDFAFTSQIEDIMASEGGTKTIEILDKWDQASQHALYQNPSDMRVIHQHVQTGMYDQINAEITRYKSLGAIPLNTPYLRAYSVVFDEMQRAQQGQQQQPATTPPVQPTPSGQIPPAVQPVAVRTAPVATSNSNNAALAAAAPRQVMPTPRKELTAEDVMNMSDAELAKLSLK